MKYIAIFLLFTFAFLLATPVALAQQASLSLSPSTGTFAKGCQFTVDVKLNTGGGQTDGTDAILLYDNARLSTNNSAIASGNIYPDYPGNNVDEAAGRITISGLSSITSAFSGSGTLATITFTIKSDATEGTGKVRFDFDPNDKAKTTDSNVVERGTVSDILSSVIDGTYNVGSGTSCGGGTATITKSGTGGLISTPSGSLNTKTDPGLEKKVYLPPSGTQELTYTIVIIGATLTVLGILGLAIL